MWDSATLQCKATLQGHEDNVRVLAVGARHVFSGSWDKTIRVWDVETLECIKVRAQGWGIFPPLVARKNCNLGKALGLQPLAVLWTDIRGGLGLGQLLAPCSRPQSACVEAEVVYDHIAQDAGATHAAKSM